MHASALLPPEREVLGAARYLMYSSSSQQLDEGAKTDEVAGEVRRLLPIAQNSNKNSGIDGLRQVGWVRESQRWLCPAARP